ncbi:MAG: AI-2E family transporter [Thermoleophilia bacterium]|nr:AI-2E family transporter [Thermoleophilia bacterium]
MAGHPHPIRIPRWVQLVGLPLLVLFGFLLAGTLGHVLFLFLAAAVIAFTLNPLVRDLGRLRLRRGIGVAVVYTLFLAAVGSVIAALGTVVVDQARTAADRVDRYLTQESLATGRTGAQEDIERLQTWLEAHGLESVQIDTQLDEALGTLGAGEVSRYAQDAIALAQGAAFGVIVLLFALVLVIVISVYMLLDMPRLEAAIDRRFPPAGARPLTHRIERSLWGYVKGQLILSTVIGASAGAGMWVIGKVGLVEGADRYALLFGVWTAVIEVIPYIGPWLSAVPPGIFALVEDPLGFGFPAVALLFVFIYQVEGHVVVPNVMASALRLHPLLVIFGLLAGAALYGIPGVLIALPTMAASRAVWEFFAERVSLEPWGTAGPREVEVAGDLEVKEESAR